MTKINVLSIPVQRNARGIAMLMLLFALPNLLGLINLSTPAGFKIHFFQIAIILAAVIFGPAAGGISGLVGSIYSAALMGNPYIAIGNMILGFFTGLFNRLGMPIVVATFIAFIVQLPFLLATDLYLMHIPAAVLKPLVISLAISNIVWAIVATRLAKPLARIVQ